MTEKERAELDNWFAYHAPTPEKVSQYSHIREEAKKLAEYVVEHVPASADRTAALRCLRNTVMSINLAIACS
jgi:uncharacterized protein YeaO (DUF488 family)